MNMHRDFKVSEVIKEFKRHEVTQVLFMFSDILGRPRAQQTSIDLIEKSFQRGIVIDGSSLEGFARIEESDLRAQPNATTARILPWEIGGEPTGLILCDIVTPSGQPFAGDSRAILRRTLKEATEKGWVINVGPEPEFFIFPNDHNPKPLDRGNYFDLVPDTAGLDLRTQMISALRHLGIEAEIGHHEVAHSQHEIDIKYAPALQMADTILVLRWVIKRVAQLNDRYATFMPKPLAGENGSGMHIHVSIFDQDNNNLFFDKNPDPEFHHLALMGQQFLAGLLTYTPEITLMLNQWVNSYKRLVPSYEAPVYVCWGNRNRSALVRKPDYEPGHEESTRLELRSPDPACNPYLAIAGIIQAGLEGIKQELKPPPPIEKDVYKLTQKERNQLKLGMLPSDLTEAVRLFAKSDLARSLLGEHAFMKLIENKRAELDRWRLAVTDFELKEYLPSL